ncbi:MAG: DUF502 domain-containing protein [Phycisphaeraceae bacterium]|nr:DUF502 domain-containing protein [Phycisphaeraceae bacterium]
MRLIGKIFLQGIAAILPLAVTAWVLWWLGATFEQVFGTAAAQLLPEGSYVTGLGVAIGIALIFVIGLLLQTWLVRSLFEFGERLIGRIPLVKTLYHAIRDLMAYFGQSKGSNVDQVVMVSFGDQKIMGLVTRRKFDDLPTGIGDENSVAVYFPMSYQIGGFTLIIPADRIQPVDLTIEEAMRFTLTAGVTTDKKQAEAAAVPGNTKKDKEPDSAKG